jgi:hypothetical protein
MLNFTLPPNFMFYVVLFLVLFVSIFAGAICYEQWQVMNKKQKEIYQMNALFYSVTMSIVSLPFAETLMNKLGVIKFIPIVFLLGASSHIYMPYVFNGKLLKFVLTVFVDAKESVIDSAKKTFSEKEKSESDTEDDKDQEDSKKE